MISRKPFEVACIGTSLTTLRWGHNWQTEVRDLLQAGADTKVVFHDFGGPSQNSNWGVTNIPALVRLRPSVALIEFCINDFGGAIGTSASDANATAMINAIKAGSPDTAIYLMIMNPPWSQAPYTAYAGYINGYRTIAPREGVGLIDHDANWATATESEKGDGTHPSLAGLRVHMMPLMVSTLRPLIPTNSA